MRQRDLVALDATAVLQDPVRREVYAHVRTARQPSTREQIASALDISRKLAAFHLEKLVEAGLLTARTDVLGRIRKVGRSPKVYEASAAELQLTIPAREHGLLADILVDAVSSEGAGTRVSDAVLRSAADRGRDLGARQDRRGRSGRIGAERALALATAALHGHGFEPARDNDGTIRLRNCPFQPLAAKAPDLVCQLNRAFIAGYLSGIRASTVEAILRPRPGECCVEIRPASAATSRVGP